MDLPNRDFLQHLEIALVKLNDAERVADVKDIRDKLLAIEGYCRAKENTEAIVAKASTLRLLAEKKLGRLIADLPRDKGGRPETAAASAAVLTPRQQAQEEAGISERQAERFVRLAKVPDEVLAAAAEQAAAAGQVVTARKVVEQPAVVEKPAVKRVRKDVMQAVRYVTANFDDEEVKRVIVELRKWLQRKK